MPAHQDVTQSWRGSSGRLPVDLTGLPAARWAGAWVCDTLVSGAPSLPAPFFFKLFC
jgi:hypothetical protein